MKNIYSWSVLLSVFTIFFYWFGYWYLQGYISYFGYDIEFYDIPIQYILMIGFLKSPIETVIFIVILVLISLILQFSKSQIKFFLNNILKGIAFIFLFISIGTVEIIKLVIQYEYSKIKNIVHSKILHTRRLKYIIAFFCILIIPYFIFLLVVLTIPFVVLLIIFSLFRLLVNILSILMLSCKKLTEKVVENKVIRDLEKDIELNEKDIEFDKTNTFDVLYSLHSILLMSLLFALLIILKLAIDINKKGINDAEHFFKCSTKINESDCFYKFNIIELGDNDSVTGSKSKERWYVTNICTEQKCIVFNEKRVVKLVDVTDKKIII